MPRVALGGLRDLIMWRRDTQAKSFVEFAAANTPEALGILIVQHKAHSHAWLKDLVFLHEELTEFCGSKPAYCKALLRELHKMRKMKS